MITSDQLLQLIHAASAMPTALVITWDDNLLLQNVTIDERDPETTDEGITNNVVTINVSADEQSPMTVDALVKMLQATAQQRPTYPVITWDADGNREYIQSVQLKDDILILVEGR